MKILKCRGSERKINGVNLDQNQTIPSPIIACRWLFAGGRRPRRSWLAKLAGCCDSQQNIRCSRDGPRRPVPLADLLTCRLAGWLASGDPLASASSSPLTPDPSPRPCPAHHRSSIPLASTWPAVPHRSKSDQITGTHPVDRLRLPDPTSGLPSSSPPATPQLAPKLATPGMR
jgi:hypothetical protein